MKGHKDHHAAMAKRASGGGLAQSGPHEEETNKKKAESMEHPDEYKGKNRAEREVKEEKKKGGEIKRKRGGHVPGHKPAHRLDKKSRGGSPKSPLSGADASNLPYARPAIPTVDAGGKGKQSH